MVQRIYVLGNNTGRFSLQDVVDSRASLAPTMWSWRLYGPAPVGIPDGILNGKQLDAWVNSLQRNGYVLRDVTVTPASR